MSNPNEQNETKKRKLHQIESIKHFDEIDPEIKYTVIASSLVTSYFALPMIPEIISQGTQVFAQYPGWTGFAAVTGAAAGDLGMAAGGVCAGAGSVHHNTHYL